MHTLHIGDTDAGKAFRLPIDAATQTFAFIARKGAGKTYAAGKLTELLLDAGVQVVILDTVGNWYGLRLAADGKGKGFDVPVFGGLRGDLPLQATTGELIADVVVNTGRSVILDLSQFSLADRKRFATSFGERLWKNKKAEAHPSPLMLVIEESQLIVPQFTGTAGGDSARMLGIYEEIIRLGRNYGIGCTMISQRPQSVNKEVLNQTECLFVLQVNGSQERKALKEWIVHQGMDVGLLDELPGLPVGTAYVWSPQWLRVLEKVKIAPKRTFDASATPKVGDKTVRREPAPLDLSELQEKMAATVEAAKRDDPRELRKKISELERKLSTVPAVAKLETKVVEVPVLSKEEKKLLERLDDALGSFDFKQVLDSLGVIRRKVINPLLPSIESVRGIFKNQRPNVAPPHRGNPAVVVDGTSPSGGMRRMMIALAQRAGLSGRQLGVRAGMSSSSGTFGTYLAKLRTNGWMEGSRESMRLTAAGIEALGSYDPLPTGRDLLNYWLGELGQGGLGRILTALAEIYPNCATKEELGALADISHTSGTFGTYLARLRTLELVTGTKELKASDELFE